MFDNPFPHLLDSRSFGASQHELGIYLHFARDLPVAREKRTGGRERRRGSPRRRGRRAAELVLPPGEEADDQSPGGEEEQPWPWSSLLFPPLLSPPRPKAAVEIMRREEEEKGGKRMTQIWAHQSPTVGPTYFSGPTLPGYHWAVDWALKKPGPLCSTPA